MLNKAISYKKVILPYIIQLKIEIMISRLTLLITFIAALLMGSCSDDRPESLIVKIIETTDIHGRIFPYDLINDKPLDHSLAHVADFVRQERENKDQEVILLDNGDILQGDPIIYFNNFEKKESKHLISMAMNEMQYDAGALGNHDIEPGPEVYFKLKEEFTFPWMAANAVDQASGEPVFQPYTIIHRKGVKVAVLGLITPAIPKWLPEHTWEGIVFQDMIEAAAKWVALIKEKDKPDLMVGLFHSGVDYTYGNQNENTPCNENASQLIAERVEGFDIIFVGHDHQGWNKIVNSPDGNEVLLLGAKNDARNVAVATINLTMNKKNRRYEKDISGELINMNEYNADQSFMTKFTPSFHEAQQWADFKVTELGGRLVASQSLFGDAAFTDIIHQLQLSLTDADISFTSPQTFNLTIEPGRLTVKDMFKFYRYENQLYTITLTGKEIKDFLEYSASLWFNKMDSSDDNLLLFKMDADGKVVKNNQNKALLANPYWNFDSAEGISYTVNVDKPEGERVIINQFNDGRPFDLTKNYSVALNSYRGSGGGDHLTIGCDMTKEEIKDRIIFKSEKDIRWHLTDWLKQQDTLIPAANSNWKITPVEWVKEAKIKDSILLFGSR
jgi:2',3'-cyclic-nucleotide 2'-phosphodiesterase/3'-nucleotidase